MTSPVQLLHGAKSSCSPEAGSRGHGEGSVPKTAPLDLVVPNEGSTKELGPTTPENGLLQKPFYSLGGKPEI